MKAAEEGSPGVDVSRGERFWLAFGLACLPCTAAFLWSLGGLALGALLGWSGLASAALLAAGAVLAASFWKRSCRPARFGSR